MFREGCATVELGTTPALLITQVLSSAWSEQTYVW
jgi:hypothetical protein